MLRRILPACAALLLGACATVPDAPPAPVEVGLIAINDFHGTLEPPRQSVQVTRPDGSTQALPAGGAAWLASAVEQVRSKYPNHLTVAAGDMTGGSQLASAIHLDEPAVGVLNRLGLDLTAVGNHEFDRGTVELRRLQDGGCQKNTVRQPCALEPFPGASYKYLAANVVGPDGKTLFPGTALRSFGTGKGKVTIGLVGLTLKGTSALVVPAGIAGYSFEDEATTINAAVESLKRDGAGPIVVLIHEGVRTGDPPDPSGCPDPKGDLAPILARLDPRIDVVVSGHTHWQYVCQWPSRDPGRTFLVTSAGLYGKLLTDIRLMVDPATGKVLSREARNVIVQSDAYRGATGRAVDPDPAYPMFAPDPEVAAFVGRYVAAAADYASRPIGRVAESAAIGVDGNSTMGGTLGNLIADAQLAATRSAGAQVAFMNPFGIRTALNPEADNSVTFGAIYRIQPFDNTLVTMTLTGAEIKALLEQSVDEAPVNQWLAPSVGFAYRYDLTRPIGDRIVGMTLDDQPIDPARDYRVTVNSFLSDGGDSFTVLTTGRDKVTGPIDVTALEEWIAAVPVRAVPKELRYTAP